MKTLQDMIKDLTNITVKEDEIKRYLENETLDLRDVDLRHTKLTGVKITKEQLLEQLIILEEE